jgi:hypothetical protein
MPNLKYVTKVQATEIMVMNHSSRTSLLFDCQAPLPCASRTGRPAALGARRGSGAGVRRWRRENEIAGFSLGRFVLSRPQGTPMVTTRCRSVPVRQRFMDEPTQSAQPTEEVSRSGGRAHYLGWAFMMVVLYVLSFGPFYLTAVNRRLTPAWAGVASVVYNPWQWAYYKTPLHKPLGWYMHLWCPRVFDKKGDVIAT